MSAKRFKLVVNLKNGDCVIHPPVHEDLLSKTEAQRCAAIILEGEAGTATSVDIFKYDMTVNPSNNSAKNSEA